MRALTVAVKAESYPLAETFTIARGSKTHAEVVTVYLTWNGRTGRGECVPYSRYKESTESVIRQIETLPGELDRERLQELLPSGAARNAVDCALWDLEAK